MMWRMLSPIDPRWTGMCGALAISAPSLAKSAQEKSSRSLILTLVAVAWSATPISLARVALQPGSTTVVDVASEMTAGPVTVSAPAAVAMFAGSAGDLPMPSTTKVSRTMSASSSR